MSEKMPHFRQHMFCYYFATFQILPMHFALPNQYAFKESRKKVGDEMFISPRYLANIENKGQQPSLQVFYDLVTRYHISVDQFFFPNSNAEKSTGRRQLDALLDGMSDKGIRIVTATAREITEVEKAED